VQRMCGVSTCPWNERRSSAGFCFKGEPDREHGSTLAPLSGAMRSLAKRRARPLRGRPRALTGGKKLTRLLMSTCGGFAEPEASVSIALSHPIAFEVT
jgi:hypothetical protein